MTESHFPAIGSMALPPNWPNRTIVGDPHEIRERVTMGETMTQAREIASTAIDRRGITTEARRRAGSASERSPLTSACPVRRPTSGRPGEHRSSRGRSACTTETSRCDATGTTHGWASWSSRHERPESSGADSDTSDPCPVTPMPIWPGSGPAAGHPRPLGRAPRPGRCRGTPKGSGARTSAGRRRHRLLPGATMNRRRVGGRAGAVVTAWVGGDRSASGRHGGEHLGPSRLPDAVSGFGVGDTSRSQAFRPASTRRASRWAQRAP